MRASTITLNIPQSQTRDAAMRAAGLDPRLLAIKPGTRVHRRNKKAMDARGHVKHKGNNTWM